MSSNSYASAAGHGSTSSATTSDAPSSEEETEKEEDNDRKPAASTAVTETERRRAALQLRAVRKQGRRRLPSPEKDEAQHEERAHVPDCNAIVTARIPTTQVLQNIAAGRFVTADWFGMYASVTTNHAQKQLASLGHREVPVDRLRKTVETMLADRELVKIAPESSSRRGWSVQHRIGGSTGEVGRYTGLQTLRNGGRR